MRHFIKTIWQSVRNFITLKDRVANVEIERRYSTLDWAQRQPKTKHDLDAPKVNANVYIATRAIADAIKGLPVKIVEVETVGGVEREVDDNDHPANELLRNPNTEHSWSDVVDHIVKSYLNDGNAILTIELLTGPNEFAQIWPRDPRLVDISTRDRSYRFGVYTANQKVYPRRRVIHIRDMDVDDPFWGIGRVNTVREEIMMDYFVNRFNSNFFRFGATLNLMFTPDHDLTEDQHQQILDAMSSEIGGAEKAFKIFINRYAGKFEYPDQKHKDIAFLDLLKHNREKIFGVFGLPPFRGGVMEYANYANALAQDIDFWMNTIKPILKVIEDGLNKQLLWPIFGQDIRIKFDLDSVPAIKGDQTAVEDRLLKLKKEGIVSAEYVREQLGIDEDAAPVVPDALKPTAGVPADGEQPVDGEQPQPAKAKKGEQPKKAEKEEVENALFRLFKLQRVTVIAAANAMTGGGSMMSVLCDPDTQAPRLYNSISAAKSFRNNIVPILRKQLTDRGTVTLANIGVFNPNDRAVEELLRRVDFQLEDIVDQNMTMLRSVLSDADRYQWSYLQLEKRVKAIFSYTRAVAITNSLLTDFVNGSALVLSQMKQTGHNSPIDVAVLSK
ncbi:MAG: phage portal protein [Patescibacteria group bacterium]|jgi:HK97 family phage portal protein